MPNRIIKETIRTDRKINELSDFQYRLWSYLITYVDDYGRGNADAEILKGFVFPKRKDATPAKIKAAMRELAAAGLIVLYSVGEEDYFYFPTWGEHQRIQTKKSKYPAPCEEKANNGESRKSTVSHGESLPESESNPNPNPIENPNPNVCAEPETVSPPEPPVITMPLNDGSEFPVTDGDVTAWEELYPAVDVPQELRNMRGWLLDNPTKRKTNRGIRQFIGGWLRREQDRPRPRPADRDGPKDQEPFVLAPDLAAWAERHGIHEV